ncbi:MAG: 30S ribosomal protein S6 [Anaerolineales bacterium]
MRKYEVTYIAHPDLDADAFKQLNEQVQGWITNSGGKVDKVDIWGKRKLAYRIKKQAEGQYVLLQTTLDPVFCLQLEQQFRLQESIMRFLIVAVEEEEKEAA